MEINLIEKKVKNIAKTRNMSIRKLCKEIGITENGLSSMFKNNTLRVDVLEKISNVLEVPINTFFTENYLQKPNDEIKKTFENTMNSIELQFESIIKFLDRLNKIISTENCREIFNNEYQKILKDEYIEVCKKHKEVGLSVPDEPKYNQEDIQKLISLKILKIKLRYKALKLDLMDFD